jgi:sterol desaturase/sphingolipid hydroxylase (fatty acid hydroxylase superfamily)
MSAAALEKLFGLIGTLLVAVFVLGLAESISSGAAGFWGGLPFWIICFTVLALVVYDFWDTCLRKKPSD